LAFFDISLSFQTPRGFFRKDSSTTTPLIYIDPQFFLEMRDIPFNNPKVLAAKVAKPKAKIGGTKGAQNLAALGIGVRSSAPDYTVTSKLTPLFQSGTHSSSTTTHRTATPLTHRTPLTSGRRAVPPRRSLSSKKQEQIDLARSDNKKRIHSENCSNVQSTISTDSSNLKKPKVKVEGKEEVIAIERGEGITVEY